MFVSCLGAQTAQPCPEGDGEAAALFSLQVSRGCFLFLLKCFGLLEPQVSVPGCISLGLALPWV